ncbi:hypothetical protein [Aquimarina litoralis]|uniref:hypothetical protein n=1 Tax=Aquimarina litoralis TaxID=584605 RepID=UPI0031DBE11A
MKLKSLKVGSVIITPKILISTFGALFILGMGIGATVPSSNNSKFALFICTLISSIKIMYAFSKPKNKKATND